ncbi:hypothetical protein L6164_003180 [Bauhinia variegata]|uniref:Uncharacterized protein n=1 Tax=Bauhinia variegata TaxID=167791 RepID=A0ACB9Q0J5_BAUVA|nr:hypothetical protein L6164_003180 [Bauhinia variegata]
MVVLQGIVCAGKIGRVSKMQAHRYEGELLQTKELLCKVKEERNKAANKLKELKKFAERTNFRIHDKASTTRKFSESNLDELEVQLAEKETSKDNLKGSDGHAMMSSSDSKRRIQDLELELNRRKESEANMFDSLVTQTKQLEQSKILVEESKIQIASLVRKVEKLEDFASKNMTEPQNGLENDVFTKETRKGSQAEGQWAKEKSRSRAGQAIEKVGSVKVGNLHKEISLLKNELRIASEAEEISRKALDDLALALKEVATEANQVKKKLTMSQLELVQSKEETESLRVLLKTTEDNYKELLEKKRKETDVYKNTNERLRSEAEESVLSWNAKETEFVNCIKSTEEEKSAARKKTSQLLESLTVAESKCKEAKGENQKLRDILKQALNEANVAKEAAGIARAENAELKDRLIHKEEALSMIAQENEILKINEAASLEEIKELKRLLAEATEKDQMKNEEKEKSFTKEPNKEGRRAKLQSALEYKETKDSKNLLSRGFSFNFRDFIISNKQHKEGDVHETSETDDDALKGSIFDEVSSLDLSPPPEMESLNAEDFDQLYETPFDDMENDRNSRKKGALLRRFGDLLKRKGYHNKKEPPSIE